MRRLLPFFALLAAGCGGSSGGSAGPVPFFRVTTRDAANQDVSSGFDLEGNPVGVVYDQPAERVRITDNKVAKTFSLKGRGATFGLGVQGDYAYFYTSEGAGFLLDTTTGEVTADLGTTVASDGDRFVTEDDAGAHSILNLKTGVRIPLTIPSGKEVALLTGDVVLLSKDEGSIPGSSVIDLARKRPLRSVGREFDNTVHYYRYSLQTTNGQALADLARPEGMAYVDVRSLNANGEAAGLAYPELAFNSPPVVVRWNRQGVPTVLGGGTGGYQQVFLADNGRLFAYDSEVAVREFRGGGWKRLGLPISGDDEVEFAPNGRAAFVYNYGTSLATAYRLP